LNRFHLIIDALERISPRAWILVVTLISLALRVGLLLFYRPVHYGDTPSYRRLAESLLQGLEHYDGTRTPGYPYFLALLGPDERVWLVQMALGLATTFLFFYMGWQITGRAWFGGIAALAHTLNMGQLFFEANILSETLTTFLVSLAFAGLFYWLFHTSARTVWLAFGLGVVTSLAVMVRPLFIYFPFWFLLFIALEFKTNGLAARLPFRLNLTAAIAYLLPVVLLVGGWINFIHTKYGDWSLTTMTGYHLIQHTGVFFEYVPDVHADLRDTYLKYRDQQIAARGTQANAIWDAIPEMQQASGYNFYDLSRVLAEISMQLILDHPLLYLRNVLKGWWYFWRAPFYWSPEAFRWEPLALLSGSLVLGSRLVLIATNLLFLVTSVGVLLWRRMREWFPVSPALWCLAGAVWAASIVQTLVDHGDNPRFLVPMQSLVVLWVLWLAFQFIRRTRSGGLV
jgi:4-amino-4-deoxy-L-arabinose transferase-like glycosyltransferase